MPLTSKAGLAGVIKRVRMGKKIERAFARDKDKASTASHDNQEDDPNRTPEPHICTGHFQPDFTELCRRNNMVVIPPVVMRPHRPPSPGSQPPPENEKKSKKDDKNKNQPPPEPEPELELDENGEPPPKTYTTKEKCEYFKPCVQVEMDNQDKLDTVNEVFIRGWKIDEPMMTVFKQCFVAMDKLHSINLWNTGLTDETLDILASVLPQCSNVKNLVLDSNPVKDESYHKLIGEDSLLHNLSLRYNCITDKGAALIGQALGSAQKSNTKLISLNLTGNKIGDDGVEHIAKGLRMNRTLLSLSLSNNLIGDNGVKHIAQVLSRFPLTHEEVVERRKLISEKGSPDRQKSPPPSRRGADSKDRPNSVRSGSHMDKGKGGKSAKGKGKDGKEEKGGKEEKHDKAKGKSKEPEKPAKKEKGSKGGASSGGRGSQASVVADAGKSTGKGKDKKAGKAKQGTTQPEQEPEVPETINPLMESVERISGELWIPGNRMLINLNLTRNKLGEESMKELLMAIQYQVTLTSITKNGGTGLMRLSVIKNKISTENEAYKKLGEMMLTRDPFYKPPSKSPDDESQG